jgi:hypothetical protein
LGLVGWIKGLVFVRDNTSLSRPIKLIKSFVPYVS